MNLAQRLATWMLGPGVARESRQWMVECGHCRHAESVWELGGIRYKAAGTKRVRGRCRACGRVSLRTVSRSL
ncbi:hypothetical protein [Erythrobacter sp.]|uniref:hypothetical protein n=1 Tax=Erythrobacter sp. TaxID=1042 RepID=UPI001425DDC3|nr:hypothetical protein [Erythrobacter sp.]QIQ86766.1 MAG: hypothetical protein G9473_08755 [Erythrobacter sp.]